MNIGIFRILPAVLRVHCVALINAVQISTVFSLQFRKKYSQAAIVSFFFVIFIIIGDLKLLSNCQGRSQPTGPLARAYNFFRPLDFHNMTLVNVETKSYFMTYFKKEAARINLVKAPTLL